MVGGEEDTKENGKEMGRKLVSMEKFLRTRKLEGGAML